MELELTVKELPLGRRCTGVSRRAVLLLAHCEPPPACAEAPSRQAVCLCLPPPSICPESQPGAPGPWLSSGWESPSLFPALLLSHPGLPALSLLFLEWVLSFSVFSTGSYLFPVAEFQHPGDFP